MGARKSEEFNLTPDGELVGILHRSNAGGKRLQFHIPKKERDKFQADSYLARLTPLYDLKPTERK